jgi:uncharacterized protein YndB with AHSA1/START domain
MRRDYYDGERPSTAVERTIASSPRDLWGLITDLDLPARFSTEYQGGEWLDGAVGPVVGARFRGRNRNDVMGDWDTICHVVECDPPSRYAWAVDDVDEPNATWRFVVTPDGEHSVVRFEVVLGPGRSGLTWAFRRHPGQRDALIAWRLEDLRGNMQAVVDGIANIAETRQTRQR